jgi:phosphofructokinase-like protein
MRIGICTGGGDCPGLNATIRAIVNHATHTYQDTCIGILDSFNGLLSDPPKWMPLGLAEVHDIQNKGGTILGSFNRGNIFEKPDGAQYLERVVAGFKQLNLDALIVIGGEGTHHMAKSLIKAGIPVVGIPKTIDNDLPGTDRTIGFASCVDFVADSVMRLRSTAESHERIMVVEVMGRDSGFIALHGGMAGGANVILIPEIPFSYDRVIRKITEQNSLGRKCSLVVVSEGALPEGGQPIYEGQNTGVKNLGGIGAQVATRLHELTGLDTRYSVLGHLQRGGAPVAADKLLGAQFAYAALELIQRGAFQNLVVERSGVITHMGFHELMEGRHKISMTDTLLLAAEATGVCLGR